MQLPDAFADAHGAEPRGAVQHEAGPVLREDRVLQRPQAVRVGGGDLLAQQRLPDASAAERGADVDRRLGDPGVAGALGHAGQRGPPRDLTVDLGDPAVPGQPLRVQRGARGHLGLEGGVAGGDALGVDAPDRGPVPRHQRENQLKEKTSPALWPARSA